MLYLFVIIVWDVINVLAHCHWSGLMLMSLLEMYCICHVRTSDTKKVVFTDNVGVVVCLFVRFLQYFRVKMFLRLFKCM